MCPCKQSIMLMMLNHKIAKQTSVVKSLSFQTGTRPQGGPVERGWPCALHPSKGTTSQSQDRKNKQQEMLCSEINQK